MGTPGMSRSLDEIAICTGLWLYVLLLDCYNAHVLIA